MSGENNWKEKIIWSDIVAGIILLAGLFRILKIDEYSERLDNTTLLYLCAAGAVSFLKYVKTFKFGDLQIELDQIKREVKEAKIMAGIAEDASKVNIEPSSEKVLKSLTLETDKIVPGSYPDDPWKGVFGGRSASKENGRVLTAEVLPLEESRGWYSVKLTVSTLPGFPELKGDAQFFIHNTFKNNKPFVQVINGIASLHLKAWGAFTVGVLTDNGNTKLELDLAELPSAPIEFRTK